ncbi:Trafficking protein particle complex subunit 13 [Hypsizygus marmoreus]|uniref:Trafficking protein particle complex subunit 13 n=1 Tax=Hypsizygus marmoreus TaxID=39966 RepID=A0A369JG87_HYPMA|nr:Trafficking protein particle complex subunit 13 [Hypsizygus marmoreus]
MDGPTHLLSLKVMRVSRPELASAWQPFYSSSPSLSAHSTASVVSLQGTSPLPGHPKTLRDLTNALELLTLPSSFGSIQLGETFSSCLCINNEAQVDIDAVSLKVEMQTATAKVVLAEFGGPNHILAAWDTFESVINHEIKELGQHVLACAVTYRLPPNARQPIGAGENADDPSLQTFRKFYKFAVTNPLSVKTKVHTPKSPSALLSPTERDKVFLEVHIQNLTQDPMHFERMQFECTDDWDVNDANVVDREGDSEKLFSGPVSLMQPQDIRQYIYVLTPKSVSLSPLAYAPGSVIPLGRLDIFWRSSFGEPGHLLTSMLSRRIPLLAAPIQQPASALPSYLKRTIVSSTPSRPQSPSLNQSRPATPPLYRPGSPSRNHSSSIGPGSPPFTSQLPSLPPVPDIEINLILRHIPRNNIRIEKAFNISFALVLSSPTIPNKELHRRVVRLAVQHLQSPRVNATSLATPMPPPETFSPRLPSSGFSTPSSATPTFNYALAHRKLLAASSPRHLDLYDIDRDHEKTRIGGDAVPLPPPFFDSPDELKCSKFPDITFVGSSAVYLPPVELSMGGGGRNQAEQIVAVQDFELSYLPLQGGYATVGGLRVLVVEDSFVDVGENIAETPRSQRSNGLIQPRVLKEWDVVSEIWVSP